MIFKTTTKLFAAIFTVCVIISAVVSVGAVELDPKATDNVFDAVKLCNQKIKDIETLCSRWSDKKLLDGSKKIGASAKPHIAFFKSVLEELKQNIKLSHNISVKNYTQTQILLKTLNSIHNTLQKIVANDFSNNKINSYITKLSYNVKFLDHFFKDSSNSVLKNISQYFSEPLNQTLD